MTLPALSLALALHARVTITQQVADDLRVLADRRRLAQAVGNVIRNAIQAMPGGGTLTITGALMTGDRIELQFADTGKGFSPAALARYAEMFYSEKEGGMGIGLTVAAEVLKAHGGTLSVANRNDGGALVRLELPAAATS
jgi:signal transduction histidine kinase